VFCLATRRTLCYIAVDRLSATWESRIGPESIALLRKRARFAPPLLAGLVLILVAAALLNGPAYYVVATLLVSADLGILLVGVGRLNRQLAASLTRHLGFPVASSLLPSFRSTEAFDAWLRKTTSGRQRSWLGGFIKATLPPK